MSPARQRQIRGLVVYGTLGLLGLSLFLFLIWALRTLILPIIVGAFLAYLFRPLMANLGGGAISQWVRLAAFVTVVVGSVVGGFRLVKSSLPNEVEKLELLVRVQYKLNQRYEDLMGLDKDHTQGNFIYKVLAQEANPFMENLNSMLTLTPEQRSQFNRYYEDQLVDEKFYNYFLKNLKRSDYGNTSDEKGLPATTRTPAATTSGLAKAADKGSTIGRIFDMLSTWLIMPLVFIFLLFDKGQAVRYLIGLIPNRYFELSLTVVNEADRAIGKYIRGTLTECALVGFTLFCGLFLIGIELNIAILIGVIAGLANAIPFLGPVIGLVVGLAYAMIVEEVSPVLPFVTVDNLIFGVIGAVIVAQVLDNAVFAPIVLGSAVNLHPLVVIVGVMGGSILFGFAGMLLAIPTIVVCKVVMETLLRELKAYRLI